MPLFRFTAQQPTPGFAEIIIVRAPFLKPYTRADGKQGATADVSKAYLWLTQALPANIFAPNTQYLPEPLGQDLPPSNKAEVLCIQLTPLPAPATSHAGVVSGQPMGAPVGGRQQNITMPPQVPVQPPPGPGQYRMDPFEDIDPSGLPASGDNIFGDSDPTGGTYTDVTKDGQEFRRPEGYVEVPTRKPG